MAKFSKPCFCCCGQMTNPGSDYIRGHNSKGVKPSKETIEKRASKLRGKKRPKEVGEKVSKALTGYKHTEETKRKMSKKARTRKIKI